MSRRTKASSSRAYCFGMIAASRLYRLENPFPAPEGYGEITGSFQQTGGEAANSAIVLSRLGLRVRLDGSWIGDGPEGGQVRRILRKERIDISRLTVKRGYGGVWETVFADENTRTVFGNYRRVLFTTKQWNRPRREDLKGVQIALIDPFFGEDSRAAARYAVAAGVPYVTVDCAPESPLAASAAAIVVSGEFIHREYPHTNPDTLLEQYRTRVAGLTVLTGGGGEIRYTRGCGPAFRATPPAIRPVDTTGAGDAFRAGLAAALLRGGGDAEIIAYASAVAALVCLSFPGVLNAPDHRMVMAFLRRRTSSGRPTENPPALPADE